jgi:hypothetical protein
VGRSRQSGVALLFVIAACGGAQDDGTPSVVSAADVDKQCLAQQKEKIAAGAEFQASPQVERKTPQDPIVVPATAIAGKRTSGRTAIKPDEDTRRAMAIENVTRTCPWFKLCLDEGGVPRLTEVLRPSCFPRYDAQIMATMRGWRYSPYSVDGVAVKVCTRITLCYSQRSRP